MMTVGKANTPTTALVPSFGTLLKTASKLALISVAAKANPTSSPTPSSTSNPTSVYDNLIERHRQNQCLSQSQMCGARNIRYCGLLEPDCNDCGPRYDACINGEEYQPGSTTVTDASSRALPSRAVTVSAIAVATTFLMR